MPRSKSQPPKIDENHYSGYPRFQDLMPLNYLGFGSYGAVRLVVDRKTKLGYALKSVSKLGPSAAKDWSGSVLRERRILESVAGQHPFVVGSVIISVLVGLKAHL